MKAVQSKYIIRQFLFGSVLEAFDSYDSTNPGRGRETRFFEIADFFRQTEEPGFHYLVNNMSKQADQVYQSFLVRCWLIPSATTDEPPIWRFELREVSAEPQKHRFSDLEQLKAFLSTKLATITVHSNREGGQVESQKGDTEWQGN